MRRMTRLLCLMLLFSLITFSCPLAEETDAPTGTPASTPMLTAVPESALAPFNVVLPEDAHVEMAEGRITLVRGDSRVVAMVISRVPDEDPAAALPILMQDFDPQTSETMDFDAQPGFCILGGVVNDAFGDGEDDLSMFSAVGTSVAMGNAQDTVKAAATYVTTAVDDDGIYNAAKHFGLM